MSKGKPLLVWHEESVLNSEAWRPTAVVFHILNQLKAIIYTVWYTKKKKERKKSPPPPQQFSGLAEKKSQLT